VGHRVFIGLSEVAGYFGSLHHGFTELGIPSTFVDESAHPFRYKAESRLSRLMAYLNSAPRHADASSNAVSRLGAVVWNAGIAIFERGTRVVLLLWAAARHDVFVFGAGQTLLRTHDLRLLRALRKKVVVVFTGSDHRPPYLSGRWMASPDDDVAAVMAETKRIKQVVRAAERNGCAIVGLGASSHFHEKPIYHFLDVGIPLTLEPEPRLNSKEWFGGGGVRVLHSPSFPEGKGTIPIRQAIQALRDRGLSIDYVEIIGRPHAEVIEAIRQCDFVVDEVYSDTPMAVLAAEAAWYGKPTVVTGYYAAELENDRSGRVRPPSVFRHPDALVNAIESLVTDPDERLRLGREAQDFVRANWSSTQVCERILAIAEERAPAAWLYDPATLQYINGWGLSHVRLRSAISRVLSQVALADLELSHNPVLEHRIMELAQ
jgi:glycosyltransferase involved in cell wall biosynthesis